MSDDYQIDIPPSFFALFTNPHQQRLREPIETVRARYEACEDLATHLVEHARILSHVEVPSEDEVLHRIHAGLRSFVADGDFAIGWDGEIEGFFWLAAQGGYGIQSAAGTALLARRLLLGEAMPASLVKEGLELASVGVSRLR